MKIKIIFLAPSGQPPTLHNICTCVTNVKTKQCAYPATLFIVYHSWWLFADPSGDVDIFISEYIAGNEISAVLVSMH